MYVTDYVAKKHASKTIVHKMYEPSVCENTDVCVDGSGTVSLNRTRCKYSNNERERNRREQLAVINIK